MTVLFADLVGFTALAERLDPEEVRQLQAVYFRRMREQIAQFGGTIEKYAGDAVLALFGAPVAHEDDAERAIHCAEGMQGALDSLAEDARRQWGAELALRVGINTGEVVGGFWTREDGQDYTVSGDAVNTAARLQTAAAAGQIVVGQTTYDLARTHFAFEPLPPVVVKGKSAAVAIFAVLGERPEADQSATLTALRRSRLVGRARELERLREALGQALHGHGQVVHVVGEPGAGKSRLVFEFRQPAPESEPDQNLLWVTGRCTSYRQTTPFVLVADLLRGLLNLPLSVQDAPTAARTYQQALAGLLAGETDALVATLTVDEAAALLGSVLGVATAHPTLDRLDAAVRRRLVVRLLREVVARRAARSPLVLLVEDAHWADDASRDALASLVDGLASLPVLLLVVHRPEWAPPWAGRTNYQQVGLAALRPEDARTLLAELLTPGAIPPEVEHALVAPAGGNPFFLEELVRGLQEADLLRRHDGVWQLEGAGERRALPTRVQEVLLARLDRLESGDRRILQAAAVLGRSFTLTLLVRVLEQTALPASTASLTALDALERLEAADFVYQRAHYPERTYLFKHVLTQEVAYGSLVQASRQQLHRAAALAIEATFHGQLEPYLPELARHWRLGGDCERAIAANVQAAERAQRLFANTEALAHYQQALVLLRTQAADARLPLVLERLGDIVLLQPDYAAAGAAFEEARSLTTGAISTARLLRKLGRIRQQQGDLDGALALSTEAEAALGTAADGPANAERVEVLLDRAEVLGGGGYATRGSYEEAVGLVEHALGLLDGQEASSPWARAHRLLGEIHKCRNDRARAVYHQRQALAALEALGDEAGVAQACNALGNMLRNLRQAEESLALHQRALAMYERIGDAVGVHSAQNNMANILVVQGDLDAAEAYYRANAAFYDRVGNAVGGMATRCNLANVTQYRGRLPEALAAYREVRQGCEALQFPYGVAHTLNNIGRMLLKLERPEEAAQTLERSIEIGEGIGSAELVVSARGLLAVARLAEGRPAEALALLAQTDVTDGAEEAELVTLDAEIALALGAVEEAATRAEQTLEQARAGKRVFDRARAARVLAQVRLAQGQPAAAAALFEESAAELRRVSAAHELALTLAAAAALPPSGTARSPSMPASMAG